MALWLAACNQPHMDNRSGLDWTGHSSSDLRTLLKIADSANKKDSPMADKMSFDWDNFLTTGGKRRRVGEKVVITGLVSPAAAHLNGLTAEIFINNSSGQFRRDDGRYSVRVVGNAAYAKKGFWAAPKNLTSGLTASWATLREVRIGRRCSMQVSGQCAMQKD